jgi:hypothetical protein
MGLNITRHPSDTLGENPPGRVRHGCGQLRTHGNVVFWAKTYMKTNFTRVQAKMTNDGKNDVQAKTVSNSSWLVSKRIKTSPSNHPTRFEKTHPVGFRTGAGS